jgi:hypothetical protein
MAIRRDVNFVLFFPAEAKSNSRLADVSAATSPDRHSAVRADGDDVRGPGEHVDADIAESQTTTSATTTTTIATTNF